MTTSFSLKQGETITSHGPIPHPLNHYLDSLGSKGLLQPTFGATLARAIRTLNRVNDPEINNILYFEML